MYNLGSTRGKGSSTRMFTYCKQNSANPSLCINKFIKSTPIIKLTNEIEPSNEILQYSVAFDTDYQSFYDSFQTLVIKYNIS